MKSLISVFALACVMFCGSAFGQDCSSGQCFKPVQATVQATAQVVQKVVSVPVTLTKHVAQDVKQVRVKSVARRHSRVVRRASCGGFMR